MIIECQTCHARFRLDESKIKGRGARVKCRKCGEGIIVLKDGGTGSVSPGPVREGGLDLSSALRDSAAEMLTPAAPAASPGNLIPFPASPRTAEPEAVTGAPSAIGPFGPTEAPAEPAAEGKDEVDLMFDRLMAAGEPPSPADPGETETGSPMAVEFSPDPGTASPVARFPAEEPVSPPVGAIAEPPAEEQPLASGEGGFLISDSETLDFLKEEHRAADPLRGADISYAISADPVDLEATSLREPSISAPPPPEETADVAESPIEGNATPTGPAPDVDVPPYREAEAARPPAREIPAPPIPPARPASPISVPGAAAAALLAIVLAAAGYLGFTPAGRKTLERAAPGAAALLAGDKGGAKTASRYEVKNAIGYYESGAASQRILVIKGQVANLSATERSGIRVLAALLDNSGKTLAESTVYAGNVLSAETLRRESQEALTKELSNPLGDRLANMHVAPGKSVPFMVLFFSTPENIDSYRLEAMDNR